MSSFLPLAELSKPLDDRIGRILADSRVPGASIAVVHGGKRYTGTWAVGRAESAKAVGPRTMFDLGSCSKSYVATAVALLAGDGKLSFDDPVRRWLPEIEMDAAWITEQLSVRDLLSNRIGLKRQIPVEALANPKLSALDIIRRIGRLDRLYPFRSGYVYFNPGFIAARLLVERVSGANYGEFLERRLFGPLGMRHSASGSDRVARHADRARGHVLWRDKVREVHEDPFDNWQGAAGVHSCAEDATHWLEFMLHTGDSDRRRLIPDALLADTHRPHTVMPRSECKLIHCPPEAVLTAYCMGWWTTSLHGRRLVQHAGEMSGWRAQTAFLPDEGIGVSVMLAMAAPRHQAIAYTVLETLLTGDSREWCSVADRMQAEQDAATRQLLEAAFPVTAEPPLPLDRYAGTYRHAACGKVKVSVARDGLEMHFVDGRIWDLVLRHIGGHIFETRLMNPSVADYMPVPSRLRFEVKRRKAVAIIDPNATYVRLK